MEIPRAVQMLLPMAETVGWLRKGAGELVRQAGLQLKDLLMQEEVRELVGERSQRLVGRTANRRKDLLTRLSSMVGLAGYYAESDRCQH